MWKEKERKELKLPKQSEENHLSWVHINSRCENGGGQFKSQDLKNCTILYPWNIAEKYLNSYPLHKLLIVQHECFLTPQCTSFLLLYLDRMICLTVNPYV